MACKRGPAIAARSLSLPACLAVLLLVAAVAVDHHHATDGLPAGPEPGAVAFAAAWDRWRYHLLAERQRSRNTVATYRVALTEFQRFIAPKRWDRATEGDLTRFLGRPRQGWAAASGGHLSAKSRATYAGAVCGFYAWAASRRGGLLRRDPMAELLRPRGGRPVPRAVPLADVDRLLAYAETDRRLEVMVWLAYGCGLRAAEIAGLRVEDVWLAEPARVRVDGKGGRERVVPLHPRVRVVLGAYTAGRPGSGPVVGHSLRPGQAVTAKWVSRELGRVMRALGILADGGQQATAHALRHTFATELLRAGRGLNIHAVSRALGHERLATTQLYVASYDADVADAIAGLPDPGERRRQRRDARES